jgi:O-antigen/teichoic acid export membrane protein
VGPRGPVVRGTDKLLMLGATGARLAVGLFTFIVLARFLGPASFGVIATAMAYTGFAALVTDFGFGVSALRRASADPGQAGAIVAEGLMAKALLTLLVTVIGGILLLLVAPRAWLPVYAAVHIGSVVYSFADLMLVIARAKRRFDVEAKLVTASSVMMLLGVGGVAALTRSMEAAAIAFAVTRSVYLLVTISALRRWLPPLASVRRRPASMLAALRGSAGYAADGILTNMSSQIDILLFGALLSAHDMGIYQAGARLVQVILPLAAVLGAVYMPVLSAAAINAQADAFRDSAKRLNIEFTALALIAGLGFAAAGPIATRVLYGHRYDGLLPLWSGFATFALLRLASAGYGIQLAALGHIRTRVAAQIACMIVLSAAAFWLLPRLGLRGTAWLLALSAMPSIILLGGGLLRDKRSHRSLIVSMAVTLAATAALFLSRGTTFL